MTQATWTEARILFAGIAEGGHNADEGLAHLGPEGWVHVKQDGGGFTSYPPQAVFRILWKDDPWPAKQ